MSKLSPWEKKRILEGGKNIYERPASPSAFAGEIASRKEEATALLKQAVEQAESDHYEGALWRAIDAAGLISFFVHRSAQGMPPSPTGRGFFINRSRFSS